MAKTPSYLYSRNGIYYFQIRVPADISHSKLPSNRLIRKSTRTGNRREAMRIARQWWVQVMSDDFFEKNYPKLAEEERDDQSELRFERGCQIVEEFRKTGLGIGNSYGVNIFLQHYTTDDIGAFYDALEIIDITERPLPQTDSVAPLKAPPYPMPDIGGSTIPLAEVLDKWIHYNTEVRTQGKKWTTASQKKFVPSVKLMIEMVGNPPANQLTKALLRDEFSIKLPEIPTSLKQRDLFRVFDESGKKTDSLKSFDDIFELAEEQEIPRLAPKTIQDHARTITRFLKWARRNDYLPPSVELESVLDHWLEFKEEDERRRAFNEDDLKKILETEEYRKGLLFKYPYRHWVPLIALYTGCRSGEASQLFVENIVKDSGTGIWYFDFSEGEGQTLKSKSSKRKVPIHSDLKKLGFLKYWEQQKDKGEKQLFSQLSPDRNGHWGGLLGRWFNGESRGVGQSRREGYKEKYGVVSNEERVATFHSFRHYVVNRSKQESVEGKNPRWDYDVWCEITGHSIGNQTVRQETYEENYDLTTKSNEMKKMKMDFLDIDGIRKWKPG